ncbi:hypothetical protein VOLCADRAFT_108095 [Volvox carteri f. nagariensis]|uniref:CCHC-type domain-containing protein n=1 Tax=Volvox carteri f. nagariensis TaxID=3068 RepID=D8UI77_VOLCA|nr:uncharacterized protein VOLCADRAFT_108095 [Volvox carteri f. nagariensis]EFJ40579.1 hypothetical protein VOLCADRAFT_108095 [Volvox carteri f. nagariensis]|eukprot:XP_002958357.1 hypothetical protein VOLCADRAFT_108095 [Volvox carteri f. nagariensis]
MGHAWDTYVSLKNQMASVSVNIAQLEMTMEQPAMKVLVSDKSGRVMERPFKDLDYVNDSWVNKSDKEHKALKCENRELNQIYHAFQKVNRNLEDEREARRDEAPPEQIEELEKATNDTITEGESLLTDLNTRLCKAMLVGWETVELLDLPDCCKSEEERSKLLSVDKCVAAEKECECRGNKPSAQKQFSAGFRQRQFVAPSPGFGQVQVGFGSMQGAMLPHQALPFTPGLQFGGMAPMGQGGGKPPQALKPTDQCHRCKQFGHFVNMCSNPPAPRDVDPLEGGVSDCRRPDWAESHEGGDIIQGAGPPAASGNINVNANWWLSVCSSSWTKQWVQQGFLLWWKQAGVTPPPRVTEGQITKGCWSSRPLLPNPSQHFWQQELCGRYPSLTHVYKR